MHLFIAAVACLLGTILWQRDAVALEYPARPVRVIIPFIPGGAPDVLLRIVAQQLQEKWHQGVVVENRAGGNTLVGTVAAIAALFDEGVRLGCHVGVDSAHATGRNKVPACSCRLPETVLAVVVSPLERTRRLDGSSIALGRITYLTPARGTSFPPPFGY